LPYAARTFLSRLHGGGQPIIWLTGNIAQTRAFWKMPKVLKSHKSY
jgi:hypothetical protein